MAAPGLGRPSPLETCPKGGQAVLGGRPRARTRSPVPPPVLDPLTGQDGRAEEGEQRQPWVHQAGQHQSADKRDQGGGPPEAGRLGPGQVDRRRGDRCRGRQRNGRRGRRSGRRPSAPVRPSTAGSGRRGAVTCTSVEPRAAVATGSSGTPSIRRPSTQVPAVEQASASPTPPGDPTWTVAWRLDVVRPPRTIWHDGSRPRTEHPRARGCRPPAASPPTTRTSAG